MFTGKKILLVGLGVLGGGVSTAQFLLKEKAILRITDKKDSSLLSSSLKKLARYKQVTYTLGEHKKEDFDWADIVVFNPDVPYRNEWVTYVTKRGIPCVNDLGLFLLYLKHKNKTPKQIWITGTRGKTTTSTWIHHLIKESEYGGNVKGRGLLRIATSKKSPFVVETSSYQLDYPVANFTGPDVAIITNISVDHLNRYKTFAYYESVKAKVFINQTKEQKLILNNDDPLSKHFLTYKPQADIYYTSVKKLQGKKGLFMVGNKVFFSQGKKSSCVGTLGALPAHLSANRLQAILAAHLSGVSWKEIFSRVKKLPIVPMREEIILKKKGFTIVNDSAGTSPEATISAIDTFFKKNAYLIVGGTDADLSFTDLAKKIKKDVALDHIFFLAGTATEKLISELIKISYFKKGTTPLVYQSLEGVLADIRERKAGIVVFSPGAKSFGMFLNEFDRGDKFTKLAKKIWK